MKTIPISFTFKGERTYIQGPDIFNKIIDNLEEGKITDVRFTAHNFIQVPQGSMFLSENSEEISKLAEVNTRCQLKVNGINKWVVVNADNRFKSGSGVDIAREEYDEDKVTEKCSIVDENIRIDSGSPYSFMETIVSMNKHLHKDLFPDVSGKWVFTRIDLEQFVETATNITLKLKHNLNFRLTKSDVFVGEDKVGVIYFSLLK